MECRRHFEKFNQRVSATHIIKSDIVTDPVCSECADYAVGLGRGSPSSFVAFKIATLTFVEGIFTTKDTEVNHG